MQSNKPGICGGGKAMAIVVCLALASSAAAQTPAASAPQAIQVIDGRPAEELPTDTLSLAIWSCNYFVVRIGDAKMKIDRIAMLREDVLRELGSGSSGGVLEIRHFTLHQNSGMQMVASALSAAAGPIGGAIGGNMATIRAKCAKEKMAGGWFDRSEVTNNRPPLIAEIDALYLGKPYIARIVYSPDKDLAFRYRSDKPKHNSEYVKVLRMTNAQLIRMLKPNL